MLTFIKNLITGLRGPPGEPGMVGPDGIVGAPGENGINGDPGRPGSCDHCKFYKLLIKFYIIDFLIEIYFVSFIGPLPRTAPGY